MLNNVIRRVAVHKNVPVEKKKENVTEINVIWLKYWDIVKKNYELKKKLNKDM